MKISGKQTSKVKKYLRLKPKNEKVNNNGKRSWYSLKKLTNHHLDGIAFKVSNEDAPFSKSFVGSDYKKWKKDHGKMGMGFWKLFGDLFRSLQTSKIGRQSRWRAGYFAGVPRGAKDSGGKSWYGKGDKGPSKSIEQIGTWMEGGRRGQPARPIFGPTTEGYIKSGAWMKRGVQSLDKMKWSWS